MDSHSSSLLSFFFCLFTLLFHLHEMKKSILIRNGTIVTMDPTGSIVEGDLLVRDGRIAGISMPGAEAEIVVDAAGCAVLPGFVQSHIHLCQTLFRGSADDLALIDWLKNRVWPMEASHTARSIAASARLGIAELIKGGTTCALTMESVNHTEDVFRVVEETGFRATVGKCMMDKGDEIPAALHEDTETSIRESLRLLDAWHGRADGRIRYCFAPRFAVSCTRALLERVSSLAKERGVMIHTHASENRTEIQIVERETGQRNVVYLDSLGIGGPHVVLAHCIHLDNEEIQIMSRAGTHVAHCPSSNLKLGSGIARVKEMLDHGVSVSFGADGAPCNNRLDMWTEMRTAALLQKVQHGAEVMPAPSVLRMATMGGAQALGQANEIGSLEVGKRADLMIVNLNRLHVTPRPVDLTSALVYSAQSSDVLSVIIDGAVVMLDQKLQTLDEQKVIEEANQEAMILMERAGI